MRPRRRADDTPDEVGYLHRVDQEQQPRPRFDKTFNIPTILAFVVALGSGYAALSSRDVEIGLLKQGQVELRAMHASQTEHQRRTDDQQSREFRDWYTLLRSDLSEIKRQLERLTESSSHRK